jgi:chorismate mutase
MTTQRVRAIRGATTVDVDTRDEVIERTKELVRTVIDRNGIDPEDLVSILFTATDDIRSAFPAEAAREAGLTYVPLMCARELDIIDGIERCIRIMVHVHTSRTADELRHPYLHGARQLRTDLPE